MTASPGSEHPTRRRICAHLRLVPGDHLRSIARTLDLGLGATSHHLDVLLRRGLVRVERVDGRSRFFPRAGEGQEEVNRLYLRHWQYRDVRSRILLAVRRLSNPRPATIARALGISRQLASYHMAHMEEAGVLQRSKGRYVESRPRAAQPPR